jgi:hypothetical protein
MAATTFLTCHGTPSDLDDLEQVRGRMAELERALRERPIEVRTEIVAERVEVPAIDAGTVQRLELLGRP